MFGDAGHKGSSSHPVVSTTHPKPFPTPELTGELLKASPVRAPTPTGLVEEDDEAYEE